MIGIAYDADLTHAKEVIHRATLEVESVVSSPPIEILVRELDYSAVKIEVRFWVNSRRLPFLESTSQVAQALKESLATAEIELPSEIYTVKLKNLPMISNHHHLEQQ